MKEPEITVRPRPDGDTPVPLSSLTPASAVDITPGQFPAVPRRQRVIPAPFRRNRIDISHHGREWLAVSARTLRIGDLVVDRGKVEDIHWHTENDSIDAGGYTVQTAVEEWVVVTFLSGKTENYFPHEGVRAFVEVGRREEDQSGSLREGDPA